MFRGDVEVTVKISVEGPMCGAECSLNRVHSFKLGGRWFHRCGLWKDDVKPLQDGEGWIRCPSCLKATGSDKPKVEAVSPFARCGMAAACTVLRCDNKEYQRRNGERKFSCPVFKVDCEWTTLGENLR